jgi:hypothetical protein
MPLELWPSVVHIHAKRPACIPIAEHISTSLSAFTGTYPSGAVQRGTRFEAVQYNWIMDDETLSYASEVLLVIPILYHRPKPAIIPTHARVLCQLSLIATGDDGEDPAGSVHRSYHYM